MFAPAGAAYSETANHSPDALLASACLPTMFQAIEIDGEAYWDGGYSGNPTITPLVRECTSHDTIAHRRSIPSNARARRVPRREILDRFNEVSFNATLLKELRMIALLRQVADLGTRRGEPCGRKCVFISSQAGSSTSLARHPSSMRNGTSSACCATRAAELRGVFPESRSASVGKAPADLDVLLDQV